MNKRVKPKKIKFTRNFALYVIIALVFLGYATRLFDWQVVKGAEYLEVANKTNTYYVSIDAARGEIFDCNGLPLATNITGFAIVFDRAAMQSKTENSVILQLTELFRSYNEKWIDKLPIELNMDGDWVFKDQPKSIAALKKWLRLQTYATAENCMETLASSSYFKLIDDKDPVTGDPIVYTKRQVRDIVGVRYNMSLTGFNISTPYIFANEISQEMVSIVSEMTVKLPGVDCRTSTIRRYDNENAAVAPHIIGFVGSITQTELEKDEAKYYTINDKVGKQGVEQAFEERLRGQKGVKKIETTPKGELISEEIVEPQIPGESIYLTIDSKFQKKCQKYLQQNIENIVVNALAGDKEHRGEDCTSGSVVVLDIKKGNAVLAAVTYPSYDLGLYLSDSDYNSELLKDPDKPLFNRALFGLYAPGSTMKPAISAAALEEGIIHEHSPINCTYIYKKYPDFQPKCQDEHGSINVSTALRVSCNYFYYELGDQLGVDIMDPYCTGFGLGQSTGIEVAEDKGVLAGRASKIATRQEGWALGDNLMFAIGQSINLFTPLQLATYSSTLATGGVRYRTHLVDRITDYGGQTNVLNNDRPEVMEPPKVAGERRFSLSDYTSQVIREGMKSVVTSGTASHDSFDGSAKLRDFARDNNISIAAKTGTAEVKKGQESDNAFFIAYAPADDPQIAVAVAIEHGTYGRFAGDTVHDILKEYFYPTGDLEEEEENEESSDGLTDENSNYDDSSDAEVIALSPIEIPVESLPHTPSDNLDKDQPAIDTLSLLGKQEDQA